jgi:hypothetical protein
MLIRSAEALVAVAVALLLVASVRELWIGPTARLDETVTVTQSPAPMARR